MTRAFLLVVSILALSALDTARGALGMPVKAEGSATIHVLAANDDGEAVAESVTAPLFAFRVEEGHVDGAAILNCQQITEEREKDGVSYPVVVLKCGDIKLALVGVDMTVKKGN